MRACRTPPQTPRRLSPPGDRGPGERPYTAQPAARGPPGNRYINTASANLMLWRRSAETFRCSGSVTAACFRSRHRVPPIPRARAPSESCAPAPPLAPHTHAHASVLQKPTFPPQAAWVDLPPPLLPARCAAGTLLAAPPGHGGTRAKTFDNHTERSWALAAAPELPYTQPRC
jgi:hypothetical protein